MKFFGIKMAVKSTNLKCKNVFYSNTDAELTLNFRSLNYLKQLRDRVRL
jgi:hypothetical protein